MSIKRSDISTDLRTLLSLWAVWCTLDAVCGCCEHITHVGAHNRNHYSREFVRIVWQMSLFNFGKMKKVRIHVQRQKIQTDAVHSVYEILNRPVLHEWVLPQLSMFAIDYNTHSRSALLVHAHIHFTCTIQANSLRAIIATTKYPSQTKYAAVFAWRRCRPSIALLICGCHKVIPDTACPGPRETFGQCCWAKTLSRNVYNSNNIGMVGRANALRIDKTSP